MNAHTQIQEGWNGGPRIIIEFVTEGLSTGTSIEFLSVYPTKEEEYCYPPLTRIKLEEEIIITPAQLEMIRYIEWEAIGGSEPPEGQQLSNAELASALLHGKIKFTQREWDEFNITYLQKDHFIKSDNTCFRPTAFSTAKGLFAKAKVRERIRVILVHALPTASVCLSTNSASTFVCLLTGVQLSRTSIEPPCVNSATLTPDTSIRTHDTGSP